MGDEKILDEAILGNDNRYTSFAYNGYTIRFKTSSKLERYTKIVEWDNGYIVVMAKYIDMPEIEEYIDIIPILENLYINADDFLKNIKRVRLDYDR